MSDEVEEGSSSPLGATPSPTGVNFSVFSRHATGVELLLFDGVDDERPVALPTGGGRKPVRCKCA